MDGRVPASTSSEVVALVLKAPREGHTALMERRPTSRGGKIEAP